MQILLGILTGLLAVDLILIAIWATVRLCTNASMISPAEIAPFIVASGVLLALLTLILNRRREASKDHLENATDLIEKSYNVLNDLDKDGRPKNSRINWLTSARLLRKSQGIAKLITESSHRIIWEEKQEYWRGRFHDLIFPNTASFPGTYYAENTEHLFAWGDETREPLSLKSLVVLYRFVRWPKGIEDPLASEENFTKQEIEKMTLFGPRGLGELLEAYELLKEKKESKK